MLKFKNKRLEHFCLKKQVSQQNLTIGHKKLTIDVKNTTRSKKRICA